MKKALLITVLAVFAGLALWFVWPLPGYNIERVHPLLRALQAPYRSVKTGYFMDYIGSVGIDIVDRDGAIGHFFVTAPKDHFVLTRVQIRGVEDEHPLDTKWMLVRILRDYPNRTPRDDSNLFRISLRPIDFVRCLIHRWKGDYDRHP